MLLEILDGVKWEKKASTVDSNAKHFKGSIVLLSLGKRCGPRDVFWHNVEVVTSLNFN